MAESMTTLQSGRGLGNTALVNSSGSLQTSVENTVSTRSLPADVHRTTASIPTSGGTLLNARSGRRGLVIQNLGTGNIHLRFEDVAATTSDFMLGPGQSFEAFNFPYEGVVRAIAASATEATLALEIE